MKFCRQSFPRRGYTVPLVVVKGVGAKYSNSSETFFSSALIVLSTTNSSRPFFMAGNAGDADDGAFFQMVIGGVVF